MTRGEPGKAARGVHAPAGEETAEFELTAEQQAELWKAAAALAPPVPQLSAPRYDAYICRRTDRVDRVSTMAFATLILGMTVSAGWHAITAAPTAQVPVIASAAPADTPVVARAPVVQVRN